MILKPKEEKKSLNAKGRPLLERLTKKRKSGLRKTIQIANKETTTHSGGFVV